MIETEERKKAEDRNTKKESDSLITSTNRQIEYLKALKGDFKETKRLFELVATKLAGGEERMLRSLLKSCNVTEMKNQLSMSVYTDVIRDTSNILGENFEDTKKFLVDFYRLHRLE